jgi:hypothetical protein
MNEMFEKASRLKLRYKTSVGSIATEDLWDVTLESLNTLAKSLNKELKDAQEESFIGTRSKANTILELKFEIVKYVIKVKLEEAETRKNAADKKAAKEKIMELINRKKDEALSSKSIAELQADLDAM